MLFSFIVGDGHGQSDETSAAVRTDECRAAATIQPVTDTMASIAQSAIKYSTIVCPRLDVAIMVLLYQI